MLTNYGFGDPARIQYYNFIITDKDIWMSYFKIKAKQPPKGANQSLKAKIQNQNRRVHTETSEARDKDKLQKKLTLLSRIPISKVLTKSTTVKNEGTDKYLKPSDTSKHNQETNKTTCCKSKTLKTEPYERASFKFDAKKKVEGFFSKKTESKVSAKRKSLMVKELKGAEKYTFDQKIGRGTFGVVYKGRDKATLQVVAIKKVFQDKKYKNREEDILKMLDHPNVIKMKDSFFTQERDGEYLNVVMDYFPDTVYSIISRHTKKNPIPPTLIKLYAYQLLRSLLYLSKIEICHRDIKPHNVLVDQQTNKLVVCDFGSAKKLVSGEPNISYICSRCYRAPELIFGATEYTAQIDMWSVGCIIAQMLAFEPLFVADNNVDQLVEIIRSLGTPTQEEIASMNPNYDMSQFRFPPIPCRDWKKIIKGSHDPLLIDLIKRILRYNPKQRLTPFQALCHEYFDEIRDQDSYIRLKETTELPELFHFSMEQCSGEELLRLRPAWS